MACCSHSKCMCTDKGVWHCCVGAYGMLTDGTSGCGMSLLLRHVVDVSRTH